MIYDQLPDLIANGFNWETMSVQALLYENAAFDPAHQRASDIGQQWLKREPLQGKFITEEGLLAALPALFYMVLPNRQYQLVLGWDDGRHDELLLGFFDENIDGSPLQVTRRGSMFVRPAIEGEGSPPTYGVWLQPVQA